VDFARLADIRGIAIRLRVWSSTSWNLTTRGRGQWSHRRN